jgi:SAM-dependent methyltransferase
MVSTTILKSFRVTLTQKAHRFRETISRTRQEDGVLAAIKLGAALTFEVLVKPLTRWQDRRLDKRLNILTPRESGTPTLSPIVATTATYNDGVAYSPTPGREFLRILRALPLRDPSPFTFIDLGCGKGRTLLLAAEHGYGHVVGIELDPGLAGTARRNIVAYKDAFPQQAATIELFEADAAQYVFPAVPSVVFLFNPFGVDTLRAVVGRIEQSLTQSPRPLVIVYYNPVHHALLDNRPALRRAVRATGWIAYATEECG